MTEALTHLLARYTRQEILRAMRAYRDLASVPMSDALEACVSGRLELRARNKRLNVFTRPTRCSTSGYFDEDFPPLLREIPDPPLVLYYEGSLAALQHTAVAVVGSRRCSSVGRAQARAMGLAFAQAQAVVVSGLAYGIDSEAHRGVLDGNGLTVAFLGSGLDEVYPRAHKGLAEAIVAAGGAIVSEYPPSVTPRAHFFPERNRLISGTAAALVLVEASERSGSLITARCALEQGRDVYAMPGPVTSEVSKGCHRLLKQGAGLVTSAMDVLLELGWTAPPNEAVVPQLTREQAVVRGLTDGYAQSLDELWMRAREMGIDADPANLSRTLMELELAGFVEQTALGYIRTS